jgi:hypothetical protein
MRKTIDKQEIINYLNGAINSYERYAGKKLDLNNGCSQVPKNNEDAMYYYGKIDVLRTLLMNNQ